MVEDALPPFTAGEVNEPLLAADAPRPGWNIPTTSGAVTSGIGKTLRYLRAEAGAFSMFRGLGYYIIYSFTEGFLNGLFFQLLRPLLWVFADIFTPVFTALLLWAFNTAWLHKVISKPSQKNWFARVSEQSRPGSLMLAIGLWGFCRSISAFITQTLALIFVLSKFTLVEDKIHFADDASPEFTALQALGIYGLNLLLLLLLVVPASIIVVRMQAFLLPETDEVIVPFDKTFGGKVVSESMGGNNKLSMLDAWRSFTWPALFRLLKTYVKYFMLQLILCLITVGLLSILGLVFGPTPTGNGVLTLVTRAM
jgi:hypothetical protein